MRFFIAFFIFVFIGCASKNSLNLQNQKAIYFIGLNGVAVELRSNDGFQSAVLKDANFNEFRLLRKNPKSQILSSDEVSISINGDRAILYYGNFAINLVLAYKE
ncbi:hypothetical protein [Campylobacter ureolyticus]|uniref:hypothetical protein n=1 Tax=Campylobacter ureolyticus TaxID=827 RepID=UPI0022B48F6B|nr:hypothetical protein [Campylobacter ureolyticus]MCZ6171863.1 hypothetical protein [Campylobacter ureolyticus]